MLFVVVIVSRYLPVFQIDKKYIYYSYYTKLTIDEINRKNRKFFNPKVSLFYFLEKKKEKKHEKEKQQKTKNFSLYRF